MKLWNYFEKKGSRHCSQKISTFLEHNEGTVVT